MLYYTIAFRINSQLIFKEKWLQLRLGQTCCFKKKT